MHLDAMVRCLQNALGSTKPLWKLKLDLSLSSTAPAPASSTSSSPKKNTCSRTKLQWSFRRASWTRSTPATKDLVSQTYRSKDHLVRTWNDSTMWSTLMKISGKIRPTTASTVACKRALAAVLDVEVLSKKEVAEIKRPLGQIAILKSVVIKPTNLAMIANRSSSIIKENKLMPMGSLSMRNAKQLIGPHSSNTSHVKQLQKKIVLGHVGRTRAGHLCQGEIGTNPGHKAAWWWAVKVAAKATLKGLITIARAPTKQLMLRNRIRLRDTPNLSVPSVLSAWAALQAVRKTWTRGSHSCKRWTTFKPTRC